MNEEFDNWEEIPQEDLWKDGELETVAVAIELYSKICRTGEWKVIRRIDATT